MKKTILDKEEQKILTGLLYNQISFGTTLEVFGELTKEGVERLNLLRIFLLGF